MQVFNIGTNRGVVSGMTASSIAETVRCNYDNGMYENSPMYIVSTGKVALILNNSSGIARLTIEYI